MWSATDSWLQLNKNGSLYFVKRVRNELQTRSKFSSYGPHLSQINLRWQYMGCEVLWTVFLGWIYAKENTVCSFFNLHFRKLSNGSMNLPCCQFCTFSNSIMSHTVSHVLIIWLLVCSFDVIHSVFVIEIRFFIKFTTEGSCDNCSVLRDLQSLSDLTDIYVLLANLLSSSKNGRRPS